MARARKPNWLQQLEHDIQTALDNPGVSYECEIDPPHIPAAVQKLEGGTLTPAYGVLTWSVEDDALFIEWRLKPARETRISDFMGGLS